MKRTLAMLLALMMILSGLTAAMAEGAAVQPATGSQPLTGNRPEDALQTLVEQGIISEDTLTAILKYMEENRPTQPDGQPNGNQNGQAPEIPNGEQNG